MVTAATQWVARVVFTATTGTKWPTTGEATTGAKWPTIGEATTGASVTWPPRGIVTAPCTCPVSKDTDPTGTPIWANAAGIDAAIPRLETVATMIGTTIATGVIATGMIETGTIETGMIEIGTIETTINNLLA